MQKSLIGVFIMLAYSYLAQSQSTNIDFKKIVFTCTPCGNGSCDGTYYEEHGTCPTCHMDLIATYKGMSLATDAHDPKTVAILVYPGVDVMDLSGPYSVFGYAHLRIITVAKTDDILRAGGGLMIKPNFTFKNFPGADILVIPGGGPAERDQDMEIVDWVKYISSSVDNILSVCSGAFFLAKGHLLDNQSATTFASLIPQLRIDAPRAQVVDDSRFVDNGKIVTSAGLSSGIDAAFHMVEKLYGRGRAQQVANQMEYNWDPHNKYVRAQLADKYMEHPMNAFALFADSLMLHEGGREHWKSVIRIQRNIPDDKLSRLVEYNLANNVAWAKQKMNELNSVWAFKGDNNSDWLCEITATSVDTKTHWITIRLKRTNAPK